MRFLPVVLGLAIPCSTLGQSYIISTIAGGLPRPVPSASSSIGSPAGVTVDSAGNVYFASLNCVFKLDRNGALTRIAGNYTAGYSGDGGPAISAELSSAGLFTGRYPDSDLGLAVDSAGNVYIPDAATNRVRKVSTTGIISTIAGTGEAGESGDGGPATDAELSQPAHLAVDSHGNLYISESLGNRVRMVSPDGTIVTVAGGGAYGPAVEGGPAIGAYLGVPAGLAVDNAGNLYIADFSANSVRKVSSGNITTVAGTGVYGYSGDGGPAADAQLGSPVDLALDSAGNLYICEAGSCHVRSVSPNGIITTVAGNGSWGYSGDGGIATSASAAPEGIAVDSAGNLFIADFGANRIRKVAPSGIISTVAGDGGQNYSGDGGPAISASFAAPLVAADNAGNLYIADRGNNRIRKVSAGGIITTVAGNGNPGFSGDGGPAVNAEVMPTGGLAVDNAGNLFIDEYSRIRKVSLDGVITNLGGSLSAPSTPPTGYSEYDSTSIAVDSQDNVYILTSGGLEEVQELLPDGTMVPIAAGYDEMTGLTVDREGHLYYTDTVQNLTIEMSPGGQSSIVKVAAANCNRNFLSWGLATDNAGNLYIANPYYFEIQKISPAGLLYMIAGNGTEGYSGDGGPATSAELTAPVSIATDGAGDIYLADPINNTVRLLKPAPTTPVIASVTNGASNIAGPIAPGEIVTIYGLNLGPTQLAQCPEGSSGLTDTELDGAQVSFNGTTAHLIYTSAAQAATIVPYSVSGSAAQVSIAYEGEASAAIAVPVAASALGIFTLNDTGQGQAAAINQDGSANSAAKPARPGDVISLYATGEGQTSPPGVDGALPSSPLPRPILPVTVTIAGQTTAPQYAGAAPGYFAGLMQINVQIPIGVAPGNAVPVSIQVGGAASQAGVTIAVAGN